MKKYILYIISYLFSWFRKQFIDVTERLAAWFPNKRRPVVTVKTADALCAQIQILSWKWKSIAVLWCILDRSYPVSILFDQLKTKFPLQTNFWNGLSKTPIDLLLTIWTSIISWACPYGIGMCKFRKGWLHQVDIKRRSLTWYTANSLCPPFVKAGRY